MVELQRGVAPLHCPFDVQLTHWWFGAQYGVAPEHSRSSSHCAQRPSSHSTPDVEQSAVVVQVWTQLCPRHRALAGQSPLVPHWMQMCWPMSQMGRPAVVLQSASLTQA
jgi:hypothetical protein